MLMSQLGLVGCLVPLRFPGSVYLGCVCTHIQQPAPSFVVATRYAFIYCLFMIAVPAVFLSQMDIERGIREARKYAEMNPISGVTVADDANNAATAKATTNSRLRVFASI